jgi:hypothetical protein
MQHKTLVVAALLAAGSIGIACANPVNIVQNGDFSETTNGTSVPTQFGNGSGNGFTAQQFIKYWTGNNGYEIWYPNVTDAQNVNAIGEWTGTGEEKLYGPIAAPPNGTMTFVGLDGDQTNGVQSSIGQTLNGLTIGATYTVTFDWAAAQLQSRTGATTESLQVSFGNQSQTTMIENNPSESFTGWFSSSFDFVANSTTAFLNFLSVGTPTGLPPVALLTNVSVTRAVPEPPVLALFGAGLLGLGWLTVSTRRRALRRQAGGGIA